MKKMILLIVILFLMTPMVAGCAKVEHKMIGLGDLKYDNTNGQVYEKNEFGEWVPTGKKIFFEGEFR